MSRPSQNPVPDIISTPRWPPSKRKSIAPPDQGHRTLSNRWSSHMHQQHRETMPSRVSTPRKPTVENEAPQRVSIHRPTPRRSVSASSQGGELKLGAEICTAILKDRPAPDGKRSSRAVRVWDAVARCLEEIDASDSSPSTSPAIPIMFNEESACLSPRPTGASPARRLTRKSVARLSAVGAPEGIQLPLKEPTEMPPSPPMSRPQTLFPCPFRKRNPARFNIRDHDTCATAQFKSILEIRDHLLARHKREVVHQCPRCGVVLESQMGLNEHLVMPRDQMCELVVIHQADINEEDGISAEAQGAMAAWSASDSPTWGTMWRLVFPGDRSVPDPDFHPVVELVEIERALDEGQAEFKSSLQEKLRLLLPDTVEDSYCSFLTGQLELVFETHLANAMRQSLSRSSSTAVQPSQSPTHRAAAHREPYVKKSTRRSRRSTMLQSIRFPDVEGLTNVEAEIPCGQHQIEQLDTPPASASHAQQRPTTGFRADAAAAAASAAIPCRVSPLRPVSHNVAKSTPQSSTQTPNSQLSRSECNDTLDYVASRDSRDSGIGLHCELCESEVCRCRDTIFELDSDAGETGPSATAPLSTRPKLSSIFKPKSPISPKLYQFQSGDSGSRMPRRNSLIQLVPPTPNSSPSLRHRPNLMINTRDISPSTESLSGLALSETFSPQSFKQRVLRTHQRQPNERGGMGKMGAHLVSRFLEEGC